MKLKVNENFKPSAEEEVLLLENSKEVIKHLKSLFAMQEEMLKGAEEGYKEGCAGKAFYFICKTLDLAQVSKRELAKIHLQFMPKLSMETRLAMGDPSITQAKGPSVA